MKAKLVALSLSLTSAFGLIAGIVEVSEFNKQSIEIIIYSMVLMVVAASIYHLWPKKRGMLYDLDKVIPYRCKDGINFVGDEKELKQVYKLDEDAYQGSSIDYNGLLSWWKRYPKGIYILCQNSEITGAVGIWPLKKTTFDKLTKGRIDEKEISGRSICAEHSVGSHVYWYFGDIVLQKKRAKGGKLHLELLEGAISKWLKEGNLATHVEVCALGFSNDGIRLLEKFEFKYSSTARDEHPVYMRKVSFEELQGVLEEIKTYLQKAKNNVSLIEKLRYRKKQAVDTP
jgi:hypothetical protein